jgi:hypothetical protein
MRRLSIVAGLASAVLAASAVGASAQALRPAGTLQCVGGPTVGFVIGSESTLQCTLTQPRRRAQHYEAKVNRVGVDLGVTERWALGFNVLTPTGRVTRNGLAGSYGGAGSSIAIGVGGGAASVAGGPGNSVVLQPIPAAGQTGLNVAFGLQGMNLVPVNNRRHRR